MALDWLWMPALVLAATLLLGLLVEFLVGRLLPRLAATTRTRFDDVVAAAVRGPIRVFAVLVGVSLALSVTPLSDPWPFYARRAAYALLFLAAVVVGARLLGGIVATYGERASLQGPGRRLLRRVVVLLAYVVGGLWLLDNLGIEITPLLTTLGLAGLAVALAFQDTLSNLFAGMYVQSDRPLDVGHYVRIEDVNIEGFVTEVGWRTTKIRTLGNNIVVIPNARVASSVVTDYDLPEPRMSLLVRVPVPHGHDPARVERILMEEVTRATGEVPGFLKDPAPFVRFIPGFTENGMEFTVISQVQTFVDQYAAQHELRHRLVKRLQAESIDLAVPARVIRIAEPRAVDTEAPS